MNGLRNLFEHLRPARRLVTIKGDSLPRDLPRRDAVLAQEDGEDWVVGLRCPCGCGDRLELMTLAAARPRWDVRVDRKRRPTLYPSVWRKTGCRSHFWLREGRVRWV